MKNILIFILFTFVTTTVVSQKESFPKGPVLSLKAGFHTADTDEYGINTAYGDDFPIGLSIDVTAEAYFGKGWYVGINYDLSFGSDKPYDSYYKYESPRSFVMNSFLPFVKYRYFFKRSAIYAAIGLGSTAITTDYERGGGRTDKMMNYHARIGGDYQLSENVILSAESIYIGMAELTMESGRSNKMILFKFGVGYVFRDDGK